MKSFILLFIKILRKSYRIIHDLFEYSYYKYLYSTPNLNVKFEQKLFLLQDNFDDLRHFYNEFFPDKVEAKIKEADLICEHIFDLLGSGLVKLKIIDDSSSLIVEKCHELKAINYQSIPWHTDFKSGYKWDPNTFYRNIKFGCKKGVDVKVPWELSRFQHLPLLGQAYILSKDVKYAKEFENQINDWINNNSICFGVNWRCTMDVAIRTTNWLVGMEYFSKNNNIFSKDFLNMFYSSIYEHGKFIRSHLEYSVNLTSNHYLSDIAGLFFIAVYCPFFKESKDWLNFCTKELENEIQKQVYNDGCDFEASTSYHRLVLEMFFYCELLGKKNRLEFSDNYRSRLKKMFEFSLYCIKPNGFIPQIGDNDSGRFLIFSKRPVLEHKYLLTLASIYYNNSDFKLSEFNFDEESYWVFGLNGEKLYNDLPVRKSPLVSKSFPDAGWYIIRYKNDYCFISCGTNGQNGLGGHGHNDKLSIELMLDGQDIIVDPGTYMYTPYPEERNKFRSTGHHNTITFNGNEQNEIPKNNLFCLPEDVIIKNIYLKEINDNITFEGEIQYFDFTHKRIIIFDKKTFTWQIIDMILCDKQVNANLIFHLSTAVNYNNKNFFYKSNNVTASIEVENSEIKIEKYYYSQEYGKKIESNCLFVDLYINEKKQIINTYIRRSK